MRGTESSLSGINTDSESRNSTDANRLSARPAPLPPTLRLTSEDYWHRMKNDELSLHGRVITVNRTLRLYKCTGPVTLEGAPIHNQVHVMDCTGSVNLVLNERIMELTIFRCSGSITLSGKMHCHARSRIESCTDLAINLSEGLHMGASLSIDDSSITRLSGTLSVNEDFSCYYCTNLTSLPERMSVDKDLWLLHLRDLAFLPEQIKIEGDVYIRDCPKLTSLPNWITTLGRTSEGKVRDITLENTGLSSAILEPLKDIPPEEGMKFHISSRNRSLMQGIRAYWNWFYSIIAQVFFPNQRPDA